MAEFAQAQQAAVDGVSKIGIQAIFVCHLPSSITAPDGLLLTTYDQLHSQLTKADTTVYAFPAFGAAQSVMRALSENGQTSSVIYECHANAGLRLLPKSSISCSKHQFKVDFTMASAEEQESSCPRYSLSAHCATILSTLLVRSSGGVPNFRCCYIVACRERDMIRSAVGDKGGE